MMTPEQRIDAFHAHNPRRDDILNAFKLAAEGNATEAWKASGRIRPHIGGDEHEAIVSAINGYLRQHEEKRQRDKAEGNRLVTGAGMA